MKFIGVVVSIYSYSGAPKSETEPKNRLSVLSEVFLRRSRQMLGDYLQTGHDYYMLQVHQLC